MLLPACRKGRLNQVAGYLPYDILLESWARFAWVSFVEYTTCWSALTNSVYNSARLPTTDVSDRMITDPADYCKLDTTCSIPWTISCVGWEFENEGHKRRRDESYYGGS